MARVGIDARESVTDHLRCIIEQFSSIRIFTVVVAVRASAESRLACGGPAARGAGAARGSRAVDEFSLLREHTSEHVGPFDRLRSGSGSRDSGGFGRALARVSARRC